MTRPALRSLPLAALLAALALSTACATGTEGELTYAEVQSEAAVRGTFDLWRGDDGEYRFHLVAGNGEILLASEGYQARVGALNGILAVLDNGGLASRYEIVTADGGRSHVNLRAANGRVIATSEVYTTRDSASRSVAAAIGAVASYLEYWHEAKGARYDIFEGRDGDFYFNLHARNGAVVLSSEGYADEASALNGAFAVSEYGLDPAAYQLRTAVDGRHYFVLRAPNNQVIARSQLYTAESSARRAIDATIDLAATVELL